MKAICIGHSVFDTTLPIYEYPIENKKYHIEKTIECGGGPASNGACLLAKWGINTSIVSLIGNDYNGKRILNEYKNLGLDITNLEQRENYTTSSSYIIANKSNGTRTIITLKSSSERKLNVNVNIQADTILLDGEHPDTARDILANNPNSISILDAGKLNEDILSLGKLVTYVICSKDFAEEFTSLKIDITDITTLINCYERLKSYFKTTIIITLEANGTFTVINGQYKIIPSIKVTAIDSTGAGDIFHGAFTYFIGNNYSLIDSIHYASIAGALSVTKLGSRFSIPELKEVLEYDTNVI